MSLKRLTTFVASFALLFSGAAWGADESLRGVPATPPERATATLHLPPGFRAELVAAEPLVTDPVAVRYDENGLAYVVEMNDYPYSDKRHDEAWADQASEPIGRVRVLEDVDGDGVFDKSTVFAEGLSWPAGLELWKGGVYVAATPDVLYLKDTDGDRRADVRRRVFTGFRKYNVQAVMNNFVWGLDHHIYAAGSSNGGDVGPVSPAGSPTVRLGRADFRFDPRAEQLELVSGGARFGNTVDDWGNRFLCNIRNPVQHIVLPARYLTRNPLLPVASALRDVAQSGDSIAVYPISPPEAWRVINAQRQAAETATKPPFDSTVAAGYITSSSGVTIYRGAAYPAEYHGNAFVGEVAGNLATRYVLRPEGVSFRGTRGRAKVEFLASTDNWFRPVNFVNAPDGTLHVLDMYRETIEHPWSMPDDLKARVDLTSGRDRGRIYRIVSDSHPPGFKTPGPPRLGAASTLELVAELENPNGWWRDTAHRLLFERQDLAAVEPLRRLLRASQSPLARLHAMWSLHGLDQLSVADLRVGLQDSHAGVREQATLLAEPRLRQDGSLLSQVLELADDPAERVRFQVAFTLGEVDDPRATAAMARIARRDGRDEWIRAAVLSSLARGATPFLLEVLADAEFASSPAGQAVIGQLCAMVGASNQTEDIAQLLQATATSAVKDAQADTLRDAVLTNLGAGLKRSGRSLRSQAGVSSVEGQQLIKETLSAARRTAGDLEADTDRRRAAIQLLAYDEYEAAHEALLPLLTARQPDAVQLAVVTTLTSFPREEVATLLLDRFPALTPAVRGEVVDKMLTRQDWTVHLFRAIEARVVPATRISSVRRVLFMKSGNVSIRELAIRLFSGDLPGPRGEVIASYQPVLNMSGDATRGAAIYKRECFNCHRMGDEGHDVGPNLVTIKSRTADNLLVNILDPNREVSPNFLDYLVITDDGLTQTGIIGAETATSITLRQQEGKQATILRSRIEEMQSTGKSLMPEGLEQKITPAEMADLLAFLRR